MTKEDKPITTSKLYKLGNEYRKEYMDMLKFYNPIKYEELKIKLVEEKKKAAIIRQALNKQQSVTKQKTAVYDPEYHKQYYRENYEKMKKYRDAYRLKNKEKMAALKKANYEANKEEYKAKLKENYQKNRTKRLEYGKAYREKKKLSK